MVQSKPKGECSIETKGECSIETKGGDTAMSTSHKYAFKQHLQYTSNFQLTITVRNRRALLEGEPNSTKCKFVDAYANSTLIDMETFQVRLPQKKLTHLKDIGREWRGRRACTRKEMKSLLGHLSHVAMVVRPCHLFLHQLFALLPLAPKPHHHIRLNQVV